MQYEVLQLGLVGKARDELSLPDRALALIDHHVCKLYREDDFRRLARGLVLDRRWKRQHFAIYRHVDDMCIEAGRGNVKVIERWIELEARMFGLPRASRLPRHRLTSYELLGLV